LVYTVHLKSVRSQQSRSTVTLSKKHVVNTWRYKLGENVQTALFFRRINWKKIHKTIKEKNNASAATQLAAYTRQDGEKKRHITHDITSESGSKPGEGNCSIGRNFQKQCESPSEYFLVVRHNNK